MAKSLARPGAKRPGLLVLALLIVTSLATVFTPNTPIAEAAPSWSGLATSEGSTAANIVKIRPSDGRVFFIGENVFGIDKEGASLYYRTDADGFKYRTLTKTGPNTQPRSVRAVFDRSSNLHVTWGERTGAGETYQTWYLRLNSSNEVVVKKVIAPLTGDAREVFAPDIATNIYPGTDNKLYISWNVYTGPDSGSYPQVIESSDGGNSWGNPFNLAGPYKGYQQTSRIVVSPNNSVFVAFKREDPANVYGAAKIGNTWKPTTSLTNNSSANVNVELSLTADVNNNAYVAFDYSNAGRALNIGRWDAKAQSWSVKLKVTGDISERIKSIAMIGTPDGTIWLSFMTDSVGLRYVTSTNGQDWSPSPFGVIWNNNTTSSATDLGWWNNRVWAVSRVAPGIGYASTPGGGTLPDSPPAPPTTPPAPPAPPPPTPPVSSCTLPDWAKATNPQKPNGGGATLVSDSPFYRTWARYDFYASGSRSYVWGEKPFAQGNEPYFQAKNGPTNQSRSVLYWDKSRMEITDANVNPNDLAYVTNGLLSVELITGVLQLGDNTDDPQQGITCKPAVIPVAGDPDDTNGPTYAAFAKRLNDPAGGVGDVVNTTINRDGDTATSAAVGDVYKVTGAFYEATTKHTIAKPFWDFLNRSDFQYWQDGQARTGKLFDPYYFAPGLPVSEAYWAKVKVGGEVKDVLIQAFERRVLTYTPSNPAVFQVEWGNVGQHYYRWRYEGAS